MNLCDGWTKRRHESVSVISIFTHGCIYCGGGDCGDSGDALNLCLDCLRDLENDKDMTGRYHLIPTEENETVLEGIHG